MITVTIHQAKTNLSKLIQLALEGHQIVIAKGVEPLVMLQVLDQAKPKRRAGFGKDFIKSIAQDFDEPLADFKEYRK